MSRHVHLVRALLPALFFALLALACRQDPAPSDSPAGAAPQEASQENAAFPQAEQILRSLAPPVTVVGQDFWTLEERMERYKAPALSLAVWDEGEIVWTAAFGEADALTGEKASTETLFQAGSISKPVAAMAVLSAWQEGELELDAPINQVLKSWQLPENELTAKTPVTPRRLLSHTAGTTVHGFPGYAVDEELPTLVQILDGTAPANTAPIRVDIEPGTRYRYSGGGTTVMQLAMSDLTGLAYPELARRRVLEPLGMTSSTYENPLPPAKLGKAAAGHHQDGGQVWGKRHVYPEMAAAGLWTTPSDLARFAIDIQRALGSEDGSEEGGEEGGEGGTLLDQETAETMITPVLDQSGLGLFRYESNDALYFGHGGADEGFQAWLIASHPSGADRGHGAAIMVNSDNGISLANELVRAIAATLDWPGFAPQPITPASVDPETFDALAGLYEIRDRLLLDVHRDGDELMARVLFDVAPTRLVPREDGTFIAQDDGSPVRFELGDDGRAVGYLNERRPDDGLHPRLDDGKPRVEVLLDRGETATALELLASSQVSEESLNTLGYTLLGYQHAEQAAAVFELAAERFPRSANAKDSLGDAHEARGDYAQAAEAFRAVLERLENDPSLDAEQKASYEKRARLRIAKYERRLAD